MLEVFLQSQTFRFPRGFLKFPSKCPGYIFGQGIIVGYGGASKMKGTPNKNPEVHHQVPNFTVFFMGIPRVGTNSCLPWSKVGLHHI